MGQEQGWRRGCKRSPFQASAQRLRSFILPAWSQSEPLKTPRSPCQAEALLVKRPEGARIRSFPFYILQYLSLLFRVYSRTQIRGKQNPLGPGWGRAPQLCFLSSNRACHLARPRGSTKVAAMKFLRDSELPLETLAVRVSSARRRRAVPRDSVKACILLAASADHLRPRHPGAAQLHAPPGWSWEHLSKPALRTDARLRSEIPSPRAAGCPGNA